MMFKMKKKLQQNSGASLILALVLFLICAMVSSAIIVAAASGSSRNESRTKNQRAYLAVSSAATLLLDEMKETGECVGQRKETIYGCKKYGTDDNYVTQSQYSDGARGYRIDDFWIPNTIEAIIVDTVPCRLNHVEHEMDTVNATGKLNKLIFKAAEEIYFGRSSYTENFTMDLDMPDERLPMVSGTFSMNDSYDVTVVLSTTESDYSIKLSMEGIFEDGSEVISTAPNACTHRVYYKQCDHIGAYHEVRGAQLPFTAEVKTLTQTIRWGTPVLEKGSVYE